MATKVMVVDDHGILRAGLIALLSAEQDVVVIGEASSGEEALTKVPLVKPEVVLMDISMQGIDGIEACRQIKALYPGVQVLILTVHEDKALLQEALHAGASGYILKRALKPELISAIQAVVKGDIYVHPSMTRALLTEYSPASSAKQDCEEPEKPEPLTRREIEVLQFIVQGYTNSQIAEKLSISPRTVEFHRANIMDKLHLKSRVGLVRYASENGLI